MDTSMMQTVIDWVQNNVGERTSKQELMSKAQSSNLPQDAKDAFKDLPEGEHSKQDVISMLQQKVGAGMGGMRGGMGGMGGGMGGGMRR